MIPVGIICKSGFLIEYQGIIVADISNIHGICKGLYEAMVKPVQEQVGFVVFKLKLMILKAIKYTIYETGFLQITGARNIYILARRFIIFGVVESVCEND